jgi:hypothetical protein
MSAFRSQPLPRGPTPSPGADGAAGPRPAGQRLHRIRSVRRQQGMSLRTASRQLGTGLRETRQQEDETMDLRLSELYRWHEILDVPLVDLLLDPDTPLSRPVMERARMVRLMKTATAMRDLATSPRLRRLAQMLTEQLCELMPELCSVGPWHSVGQRRSLEDVGRIVERSLPDEVLHGSPLDGSEL